MLQLKFKKQKQKQNKTENQLTISQNLEKDHKIENLDFKDHSDYMINLGMHYSNKESFQQKNNQFRRTNYQKTYENNSKIKKKPIKMNFCKLVEKDKIIYVDDDEQKQKLDKKKKTIDLDKMSNCSNQDEGQQDQKNKYLLNKSLQHAEIGIQTDETYDINKQDFLNLMAQEQQIANSLYQLHEKILKLLHSQE